MTLDSNDSCENVTYNFVQLRCVKKEGLGFRCRTQTTLKF